MKRSNISICNLKMPTFVAVMVLTIFSAAHACNVPVFRFALERWRPDPYRLTVFHRGPLADAERALIGRWFEAGAKTQ